MVAEADRAAVLLVAADLVAELGQAGVRLLGGELGRPLEGGVGLGDEAADRDRAADVVRAGDLAALLDHVRRHVGDLEDVVVGLRGQAAHEVQLHLTPAVAVGRGDRTDQVLLRDHLVDDLAHALRAALGGEGQAGAAAVAGQLVGQVDVEGVDARGGQGEADLVVLVAVREALGDVTDLGVVRRGQREEAHLLEARRLQALLDHVADTRDRTLAHRAGDHAGLAEAAAARAAAEDLHRHALVDRFGQRDQGLLGVRPLVQVHHGVLGHAPRDAGAVRHDAGDTAVGEVLDVVERRDVHPARLRQAEEDLLAAAGAALGLPLADDPGHVEHGLLAVADDRRVDEVGDRLRVEGRVAAGQDDRVVDRAVLGLQGDSGEVQGGEHVRVAELRGEAQPEHVEGADRPVGVHRELRDAVLTHQRLQVRPHAVGALGEDALLLVEDLVEDHDALVGQTDLVRVRVHERPADVALVPRLDRGIELSADVLDGLLHMREQCFELREHRLGGFGRHLANLRELTGVTIKRNPPGGLPRTLSRTPCA